MQWFQDQLREALKPQARMLKLWATAVAQDAGTELGIYLAWVKRELDNESACGAPVETE